jgi:Mn-dependent DtxR family transcriptional regulator
MSNKEAVARIKIHQYSILNGCPPAEADMQRFFQITPPSVHSMVLKLERRGLDSAYSWAGAQHHLDHSPRIIAPLKGIQH